MFSVVCLSFVLFTGRGVVPHVTITHDALDLHYTGTGILLDISSGTPLSQLPGPHCTWEPLQPLDTFKVIDSLMASIGVAVQTCELAKIPLLVSEIWSLPLKYVRLASGRLASYWNAFLFRMFSQLLAMKVP